jgi:hypothetical protein
MLADGVGDTRKTMSLRQELAQTVIQDASGQTQRLARLGLG